MLDFNELRKEVAIRHNVLLGPDDPILVTVTLNDLVLNRYVEILAAQNAGYQKALAALLHEQQDQAKVVAGRIITDAANYVSDQVRQAVAAAVADASTQLRQDLAEARAIRADAAAATSGAQSAKVVSLVAAGLAGVCAIVALVALVVVLVKL